MTDHSRKQGLKIIEAGIKEFLSDLKNDQIESHETLCSEDNRVFIRAFSHSYKITKDQKSALERKYHIKIDIVEGLSTKHKFTYGICDNLNGIELLLHIP